MNMISLLGMENYSESIDYEKINFMNSYLERIIPEPLPEVIATDLINRLCDFATAWLA